MKKTLNEKEFNPPFSALCELRKERFGKICANISILSAAILLCSVIATFLYTAYVLVLALFLFATLGIVLLAVPNYFDLFGKGKDFIESMYAFLASVMPYLAIICFVTSILGLIFLINAKGIRATNRIIFCAFTVAVAIIFIVMALTGGLN